MHLRILFHLALLSFAFSFWTSPAKAESWTKTYQLSGMPTLTITADDADIRVSSWARPEIEATIKSRDQHTILGRARIDERQVADSVTIAVRKRRRVVTLFDDGAHQLLVEVHMPVSGHVILKTGDGDIAVSGVEGDLDLHTGDGSQTIRDVAGSLRSMAGDGSVNAKGVFGSVQVTASDGNVDLEASAGSRLDGDWRLQIGDGDLRIALPPSLSANLDAHTANGSIDAALPVMVVGPTERRRLRGVLAKGGHVLAIRVGDGNIDLRQAS